MHTPHEHSHKEIALWTALLLLGGFILCVQLARASFAREDIAMHAVRQADLHLEWTAMRQAGDPMENDRAADSFPDPRRTSDALVEAIIQIESGGDPLQVGSMGERGLLQLREATWRETTERLFGRPLPFSKAFDPELNRQVGRAYLARLQTLLHAHRAHWKADERTLLLAAYNAGPGSVRRAGYDPQRLPASVRDYAGRGAALHEHFLEADADAVRTLLLAASSALK